MTDELKARIEKTMQNLRRNRMEAYYCENSAEARELVKTLISKGDVISNGGSVTLKQTGIYDIISSTSTARARASPARRLRRYTARPSVPTRFSQAPTPSPKTASFIMSTAILTV